MSGTLLAGRGVVSLGLGPGDKTPEGADGSGDIEELRSAFPSYEFGIAENVVPSSEAGRFYNFKIVEGGVIDGARLQLEDVGRCK